MRIGNVRFNLRTLLGAVTMLCANVFALEPYPSTAKRPVTDVYHGISLTENYRWLENLNDPEVRAWADAENAYTHAFIDKIPSRPAIRDYFKNLYTAASTSYYDLKYRHGLLFAQKFQPPKEQSFIVCLKSPNDTANEKVVFDPNVFDTTGSTSMDFYVPSPDGRYIAVSLSKFGSEDGTVHVFDVATGKALPDQIPRVNYPTGGGSVAWTKDNTGIYYTRYPDKGERAEADMHFYQQVYYHKFGTPVSQDTYVIGKEFPRIAEIELEASDDGNYMLATVLNGDGGEHAHYLLNEATGQWTQLTKFKDMITTAKFGIDQALYMLSLNGSPKGKLLRMNLSATELSKSSTVVPESDATIKGFEPTASRLYVVDLLGGPSRMRVFDMNGKEEGAVPVEPISSVGQPVWLDGDKVLYSAQSYLKPSAWYEYDPSSGAPVKTALAKKSIVNFDDCEVRREFAISKDGTKVPMNIIHRKGTELNGRNPTILYGYGGYSISMTPGFNERNRLWLDQGGVYVIANLRGGGEFGDEWHRAGNLTTKQNVFDDFAACARWLIDNGYTSPSKLAIEGGSNGGLLMGAALTQHPEFYAAVISYVGIYDMLRVELSPNGEFNTTEFGTVKDKAQFEALYGYSPYHHVVDGAKYPAVLFLAGDHDGRVDPANSRKMTARMQAATSSGKPVLLRTSATAGHGIGTSLSENIEEDADVFAFLFDQLGMTYRQKQ
ncbi:MAG: prolyl oligopeptidase family serine peptidase [Candidatus Zixiibacteriota bacterium]